MQQGALRIGIFLDDTSLDDTSLDDTSPGARSFARSRPAAAEPHHLEAEPRRAARPRFGLDALSGRVVELSAALAPSRLSFAFGLIAEAQRRGDSAAWVTGRASTFFPPDAAANGVAVDALPVVFVPDAAAAARSADKLVRSGGFGLVVIDLVRTPGEGRAVARRQRQVTTRPLPPLDAIPPALLSRLAGLAQQHEAAIVFLTDKPAEAPSLGPLVSLRCEAVRQSEGGRFVCLTRALKDKRCGPGWTFSEVRRGPLGLR